MASPCDDYIGWIIWQAQGERFGLSKWKTVTDKMDIAMDENFHAPSTDF